MSTLILLAATLSLTAFAWWYIGKQLRNAGDRRMFRFLLLFGLAMLLGSTAAHAAAPVHAGGGRIPCATLASCHRAIDWGRRDRAHLRRELAVRYTRDATYAIRLASAAFGISEQDMRTIARCESNLGAQKYAEAGSGASGLFQFLPSTFARTPFAGFDIFDAEANAMAAAWLVRKDGNWREWSCSSITGVH